MDNQRDNSAYTKLLTALEKNELHRYLIGEGDYQFVNPFVEEPTDIASIFISGLNHYVLSNDPATLNKQIKAAMLTLMNSPEGCWWTIRLIKAYLFQFHAGALKFEIPVGELLPAIQASLNSHKASLQNNKAFTGWRFEGGLWQQVGIDINEINTTLTDENKIVL
jgi:hypothetical protein